MKVTTKTTTVKTFTITEKEAFFLRDVFGGMNAADVQKAIESGMNYGGWTIDVSGTLFRQIFDVLSINLYKDQS